ncbi:hypothetical protein CDD83_5383 [Cordyceps sp. RAO-2017]|nr:hypothetical protein CDD83_5383 [Cordyceps sp. RAO-2017]
MKFSAILVSLAAVLAAAAPNLVSTQDKSIESISNATALGVDVWGPMPQDAVRAPDGYYTAEPGTKAWAWIRAQIDLTPDHNSKSREQKRQQYANIGIGMFVGDNCTGQAAWYDNVIYTYLYFTPINMFSVGISSRGLRSNERLDFNRRAGSNLCGTYLYTAASDTPSKGTFLSVNDGGDEKV